MLSIPSCVCGPRLLISWRNVCTDPRHFFKLGHLSFYYKLSEEFYVLDKIFVPILWLSFHFSDGLL